MKLLGEGLLVTVFAMAIVFAVLIVLMYVIKLETFVLRGSGREKKQNNIEKDTRSTEKSIVSGKVKESVSVKHNDDGEIVAAIISAICASTGCSAESFKIKSIKRIENSYSEWRHAGIAERN